MSFGPNFRGTRVISRNAVNRILDKKKTAKIETSAAPQLKENPFKSKNSKSPQKITRAKIPLMLSKE